MNRINAISMMFIFLMNLAGGSGVLLLHRMQMHERIERMIMENSRSEILVTFHFSMEEAAALNWFEAEREFMHSGNMYDIVRTEKTENGVIYHCINDTRETEIFQQLEKQIEKENRGVDKDPDFAAQLFGFLSNLYCTALPMVQIIPMSPEENRTFYSKEYTSIAQLIPCEPPEANA